MCLLSPFLIPSESLSNGSNLQALSFLVLFLTFLNAASALKTSWKRRFKNSKRGLPFSSIGTEGGDWQITLKRTLQTDD